MSNASANDSLHLPILQAASQSLKNTFEQMVFVPVTVGEPVEKADGNPTGSISGTIGLTGTYNGGPAELRAKLSLIFSDELAMRIFRGMMMMDETTPVEMAELRDVVGELTNMTAGGAKTILSGAGFKLSLSLPSVAVGHDHYLGATPGIAFSKVVPVTFKESVFYFEVSIS